MSQKNIFEEINKQFSFLDDLEDETKYNKSTTNKQPQMSKQAKRHINNYNLDEDEDSPKKSEMEENIKLAKEEYLKTAQGKFASKPLKKEMSLDEAYEFLEVRKGATDEELTEMVDKSNLDTVRERIKKAEGKYYAFLNKEFNILNHKMIKCCIHCYDNPNVRLKFIIVNFCKRG